MRKRYFGNKKADSKWEGKLMEGLMESFQHHNKEHNLKYSIPKTYEPDFVREVRALCQVDMCKVKVYVEAKGRFRDRDEARKYKYIRDAIELEEDIFIFLFYKADTPMPFAKKRKDGTKLTHGEWATLNNFEWYEEDNFPEDLR
jgi:hypothetical protein